MSPLLLLAYLCGAAARGATARGSKGVSLRPEGGFVSFHARKPESLLPDGASCKKDDECRSGDCHRGDGTYKNKCKARFNSWMADETIKNLGWRASTDDDDDDDDDFMARQECWSQTRSCLADIGKFATPDFSADGIFIATDATIREALWLWCQNSTRSAAEET